MIDHLNTLENLVGKIDGESQIDIILELLPDSFNQVKLNCSINKIDFILAKLLNALKIVKCIIKGHPSINNIEKTSSSKPFPRERASKKSKKCK